MTYTFANKEDLEVTLEAIDKHRKEHYTYIKSYPNHPLVKQWHSVVSRCEMIYADLLDLTSK